MPEVAEKILHVVVHQRSYKNERYFPWFEFKDEEYEIRTTAPGRPQANGDGYVIVRVSDLLTVADGMYYISEIRDFLAQAVAEDWPTLEDTNPAEYAGPASHISTH